MGCFVLRMCVCTPARVPLLDVWIMCAHKTTYWRSCRRRRRCLRWFNAPGVGERWRAHTRTHTRARNEMRKEQHLYGTHYLCYMCSRVCVCVSTWVVGFGAQVNDLAVRGEMGRRTCLVKIMARHPKPFYNNGDGRRRSARRRWRERANNNTTCVSGPRVGVFVCMMYRTIGALI